MTGGLLQFLLLYCSAISHLNVKGAWQRMSEAPHILNLNARCIRVASFMLWSIYCEEPKVTIR